MCMCNSFFLLPCMHVIPCYWPCLAGLVWWNTVQYNTYDFFFRFFLQTRDSLPLVKSRRIRMMKHISLDVCIYVWFFFNLFFADTWFLATGRVSQGSCLRALLRGGSWAALMVSLYILFSEFFQVRIYHFIYFVIYHLLAVLIVGVCVWMYFGVYVCSSVSVCLCVCVYAYIQTCVTRVCVCACMWMWVCSCAWHRVAKSHKMPYLNNNRSFPAKEPNN